MFNKSCMFLLQRACTSLRTWSMPCITLGRSVHSGSAPSSVFRSWCVIWTLRHPFPLSLTQVPVSWARIYHRWTYQAFQMEGTAWMHRYQPHLANTQVATLRVTIHSRLLPPHLCGVSAGDQSSSAPLCWTREKSRKRTVPDLWKWQHRHSLRYEKVVVRTRSLLALLGRGRRKWCLNLLGAWTVRSNRYVSTACGPCKRCSTTAQLVGNCCVLRQDWGDCGKCRWLSVLEEQCSTKSEWQ